MSTPVEARTLTAAEFLALTGPRPVRAGRWGLVELSKSALSSLVALEIGARLRNHANEHQRAGVLGADCGYRCFPGHPNKGRKPDISVVLRERMLLDLLNAEGWVEIAPDLAVEVVSLNDTAWDVETKVQEYLEAGVRLVWIVSPPTRTVYAHRPDGSLKVVRDGDELRGEDILPGFACPVAARFPPVPELPAAT